VLGGKEVIVDGDGESVQLVLLLLAVEEKLAVGLIGRIWASTGAASSQQEEQECEEEEEEEQNDEEEEKLVRTLSCW
jgi:ribosomal protein L12E/L44/L45/RPP1/RPP2